LTLKKKQGLSVVGLTLTPIIWGFAFVVVKGSLDKIPPFYMLAFRFTIAAAALALIFIRRLIKSDRSTVIHGIILGVMLFVSYAFQTVGCQYTTAGKNAFLTAIYVIIVPFLHWIINGQRPDAYINTAAVMAIIGIGLISLGNGIGQINIGDLLTIVCGFSYALHMVFIDRYTEQNDPVPLTVIQLAVSAVLSWICAPILDGGFPRSAFEGDIIAGMLYLGLMSTMLAFLLQNVCQKYTSPSTAALLLSTESVFGMLFSVIFTDEQLSSKVAVGCVMLFSAIIIAQTKLSFLHKKQAG
jgi:drug/metabolite transporter (DMT)-like permease